MYLAARGSSTEKLLDSKEPGEGIGLMHGF
jgi:hypothetical protein